MRKKKYLKIILLLIPSFLINCHLNNDLIVDLGNDYQYVFESSTNRVIFKSFKNLKGESQTIEIVRTITNYEFDNTFIIAMQIPIIEKERVVDENIQLENPKVINYWIIDKQKNILYGPFSKNKYFKKRKELRINKNLFFDNDKD